MRYVFIVIGWFWVGIGVANVAMHPSWSNNMHLTGGSETIAWAIILNAIVFGIPGMVVSGIGHITGKSRAGD